MMSPSQWPGTARSSASAGRPEIMPIPGRRPRFAARPWGRRAERRGRLPGMVMISERPAEADDRAVPGHWEGDIILGEGGRTAVGTLVERTSRFLLLLHLDSHRSAEAVDVAMRTAVKTPVS